MSSNAQTSQAHDSRNADSTLPTPSSAQQQSQPSEINTSSHGTADAKHGDLDSPLFVEDDRSAIQQQPTPSPTPEPTSKAVENVLTETTAPPSSAPQKRKTPHRSNEDRLKPHDLLKISKSANMKSIVHSLVKNGKAAHPRNRKKPGTEEEFEQVISAARKLNVPEADIEAMRAWDGEERSGQTLSNGEWVSAGPMEIDNSLEPVLNDNKHREFYKDIHGKVDKHLSASLQGDSSAQAKIEELNGQITVYNKKFELPQEHIADGTVDIRDLRNHLEMVEKADADVRNDPQNEMLREACKMTRGSLDKLFAARAYPDRWKSALRTVPGQLHPSRADDKASGPTTGRETTQKAPVALEKWWTWASGTSVDGKRILAWRSQGTGTRCVVEETAGCPVWAIKSGSAVGLLEVDKFKSLQNSMRLGDTAHKRTWTYKDRGAFQSLRAVAISDYKIHDVARGRRTPETYCWVDWGDSQGVLPLTRSDLGRVLGKASADFRIDEFCKRYGKQSPKEIQPSALLNAGQRADAIGESVAKPAGSAGGSISAPAGIDQRVDAIEATVANVKKDVQATKVELEKIVDMLANLLKQNSDKMPGGAKEIKKEDTSD